MAAETQVYQCQTCTQKTEGAVTEVAARVLGWRIWDGTTMGGQESSVRFCPICCGETEQQPETGEPVGYDAECVTCNSRLSQEGDGPFTEAEAEDWESDHECEPEVFVIAPKRKAFVP